MVGSRPLVRVRAVTLLVWVLLWGAPARGDRPAPEAEVGRLTACLRAFKGGAGMDAALWTPTFARECLPECAALNDAMGEVSPKEIETCGYACSAAALKRALTAAPERRWALLVKECGRDHFGLPAGQEALASPKWFSLHRAGQRLAAAAHSPTPAVRAAHAAMARLWREGQYQVFLPLPAYVPALYDLPRAKSWADRSSHPNTFVVVRQHTLSVAPVPSAALLPDGARLVIVAPEPFPGKTVGLRELRSAQDALRPALLATEKPFGIRIWGARLRPRTPGEERKAQEELPRWMRTRRSPLADLHLKRADEGPLVLADGTLRAARLVEVVAALGDRGAWLAVKAGETNQFLVSAQRHHVALFDASLLPKGIRLINVRMTGGTYLIEGTKATSAKQAREVLARFKPREGEPAPGQSLVIKVVSGKVEQLVELLDAAPPGVDDAFLAPAR